MDQRREGERERTKFIWTAQINVNSDASRSVWVSAMKGVKSGEYGPARSGTRIDDTSDRAVFATFVRRKCIARSDAGAVSVTWICSNLQTFCPSARTIGPPSGVRFTFGYCTGGDGRETVVLARAQRTVRVHQRNNDLSFEQSTAAGRGHEMRRQRGRPVFIRVRYDNGAPIAHIVAVVAVE